MVWKPCYKSGDPKLFFIAIDKETSLSSCLGSLNDGGTSAWNIRFVRAFHDWELESIDSLFEISHSKIPSGEGSV